MGRIILRNVKSTNIKYQIYVVTMNAEQFQSDFIVTNTFCNFEVNNNTIKAWAWNSMKREMCLALNIRRISNILFLEPGFLATLVMIYR